MFELLYDLANEMNGALLGDGTKRSFPVDVTEENGNYHVFAAIPGFNKDEIKVDFEDSVLTISAEHKKAEGKTKEDTKKYLVRERGNAAYERSLLFDDFNEDSISAKYENGILEVILTAKAPEVKEKRKIVIE